MQPVVLGETPMLLCTCHSNAALCGLPVARVGCRAPRPKLGVRGRRAVGACQL